MIMKFVSCEQGILTKGSLSYNELMVHQLGLFLCLFSFACFAQDERFYRELLAGESLTNLTEKSEIVVTPISVSGKLYHLDLNGDGLAEKLQPVKKDGVDALVIHDSYGNEIFEAKLWSSGGESVIRKLRLVHLSSTVKCLIIFLDEGVTQGTHFESTGRISLLSFENNDLKTLKLAQGPHIFHEKEAQRDQYIRRSYIVDVTDLDLDGTREVVIHYNHIQRIMMYEGKGVWKRL
jgi:hypothetical protein